MTTETACLFDMSTELTTTEPSVALMLQGVLQSGLTLENTAAVEKMLELYERMESKRAEKAFNAALAAFQADCPEIVASSAIPNRGKYERFENIMHTIKPLLAKHGLSVTFTQSIVEGRIVQTCRVKHVDGHSESTPFAVRLGGKADTDTQADCKASTTAKRYALCSALNIVIHQDEIFDEDGAKAEGEFITREEADELAYRLTNCGGDREAFLAYAQADSFYTIFTSRLPALKASLARKEKEASRA